MLPHVGRLLGVDWGDLRIGLALSDESQVLASPLETLVRRSGKRFPMPRLLELVAEHRPVGVVVIAGTGHVAAGRDPAGRAVRTLGLGPMYGDFGSATDVAEEAVRAVADAYTGRGPATSLSRLLPPLAGCASAEQLLQRLSRGLVPLPEAAPLVLQEAEAGDPACRQIVLHAGASLGESAAVVARRLGGAWDGGPEES